MKVRFLTKSSQIAKKNQEQYKIHNKLIVLANKCDEMFMENGKLILEDEHKEMFDQITKIVNEKVSEIHSSLEYKILPISIEDSYIYRMFDRNPTFDLDMKYVNKFGYNEYGKSRWNKLSEMDKRSKISKIIRECDVEETFKITGFKEFRSRLNWYLKPESQKMFIRNHIVYELSNIDGNTKIDIQDDIQMFYKYYVKSNELQRGISKGVDIMRNSEFSSENT